MVVILSLPDIMGQNFNYITIYHIFAHLSISFLAPTRQLHERIFSPSVFDTVFSHFIFVLRMILRSVVEHILTAKYIFFTEIFSTYL